MIEGLVLGIIQGVTEWLPISSEGVLTLVGLKFFGRDIASSVSMAVFLHIGTFFSALFYLRKEVFSVFEKGNRKVLLFLFQSTVVTAVVGVPLLYIGMKYADRFPVFLAVSFVGIFLLITGIVQLKKPEETFRSRKDIGKVDTLLSGALQGLAALPGFSRSGLTVSGFLARKFKEDEALRLSFLMSLPAVLGANIFLNIFGESVRLDIVSLTALTTALITGFFTIGLLLKISRKLNFGWFAIFFGAITLIFAICESFFGII